MGMHLSRTIAEGRAFMQMIDGKAVDAESGERLDIRCPSDGKVFASIPASAAADVDRAMAAARAAFENGPWRPHAGIRTRPHSDPTVPAG